MHAFVIFPLFFTKYHIRYLFILTSFFISVSPVFAAETLYTYDSLHRLTKFSHSGTVIEYAYDANGNRLIKSVCAPCRGDLNSDGQVDVADLRILVRSFGRHPCQAKSICPADFDADGDVDVRDMKVFKADFGRRDCP